MFGTSHCGIAGKPDNSTAASSNSPVSSSLIVGLAGSLGAAEGFAGKAAGAKPRETFGCVGRKSAGAPDLLVTQRPHFQNILTGWATNECGPEVERRQVA